MLQFSRLLLLVALLASAGCATPTQVSDRLFFGRAIPGGGNVSEKQWNAFVAQVIVPRFPDGFTILRGSGHWKGDDGKAVSEQSWVLEVVHKDDPLIDAKVAEIARAYRECFKQDAVMCVRTPAGTTFYRR